MFIYHIASFIGTIDKKINPARKFLFLYSNSITILNIFLSFLYFNIFLFARLRLRFNRPIRKEVQA